MTTSLPLAWEGDRLVVIDPAALAIIDRPYLSPSSASAIRSCPARFAADRLLPRIEDPFGAAELGTAGHTVLERLYSLPHDRRTRHFARDILDVLATEMDNIGPTPEVPHRTLLWKEAVWSKIMGIFDVEKPTKIIVRELEWEIVGVEVAGVPFRGVIDRTDITSTENLVGVSIVDYKTGKYKSANLPWGDENGDQIRLYAEAVRQWDGRMPIEGRLIYTAPAKHRYVSLSPNKMKETLSDFATSWDILRDSVDNNSFCAKTSPLCSWCPLVSVCPTALADGRRPEKAEVAQIIIPVLARSENTRYTDEEEKPSESGDVTPVCDTIVKPTSTNTGENPMSYNSTEDKPWVERLGDDTLNLNAYASTAVFGIVEIAVSGMVDQGVTLTQSSVDAYAQTLANIVLDVQNSLNETSNFQLGTNTRIRGALRTALEAFAAPFGGDAADWERFVSGVTKRTLAISKAAIRLWENETPNPTPWTYFLPREEVSDDFAE